MGDPGAEEARQEREQQESLERIEAGGIPLAAERRLRELAGSTGGAGASFTSDLSVNGFALCHELGLKPLSQVMGSSIYQIGYQGAWNAPYGGGNAILIEMDTLTQALNQVRGKALARLGEEARHVGADAVVGVQTRAGESQLDTGTLALEHMVFGTAVRREGAHTEQPVLTELSVAEYAMLLKGGFEPLGIVASSAVFFVADSYEMQAMKGLGGRMMYNENQELTAYTQGVYAARERTMERLGFQAQQLGASGIVGVRIEHTARPHTLSGGMGMGMAGNRELSGLMVTFTAVGTAIEQRGTATIATPEPTIDLWT